MLYNNFIDKHDLHLNKAWIRKKRIWLPLPPQKKSQAKKEKHSKTSINFKFFPCFFVNTFFVFCFLFLFLHLLSCAVFCFSFVFFFLAAFFFVFFFLFLFSLFYLLFPFFCRLFFAVFYFAFILCFFCFSVFVCASFCAFFCWNQSCWFLRTSPVLVKINCLDLGCVKHIGLTDTPLSQHDFLRCFVTVVLRNFPRWHRDGLRQRQDRGFLSLKQLGSWRQKHGMEEEIPGLEFEGVHHVQLSYLVLNFNFLEGVCYNPIRRVGWSVFDSLKSTRTNREMIVPKTFYNPTSPMRKHKNRRGEENGSHVFICVYV